MSYQPAKQLVLNYQQALQSCDAAGLQSVLERYVSADSHWYCLHPFGELSGRDAYFETFWKPLQHSFAPLQRRPDIFLAGDNDAAETGQDTSVWVASMGNYFGLFDKDWLGIPATGRLVWLRYCEFYRVENNQITGGSVFFDLLSVMKQAGCYPLPAETGHSFMYPGPVTHDGLLFDARDPGEGQATLSLINRMVADLSELNESGSDNCPPELLARCWADDMLWYGPTGIGASYTIPRYQQQHQFPFRQNLTDKKFNGHISRIAEGDYGCFFGWPNLTNRATGGFLGLPASDVPADMRVVDVYRREKDKLAENWIFIDIPHYLNMQGLDILGRLQELRGS